MILGPMRKQINNAVIAAPARPVTKKAPKMGASSREIEKLAAAPINDSTPKVLNMVPN